jgi:hypothetical protein
MKIPARKSDMDSRHKGVKAGLVHLPRKKERAPE